MSTLRLDDSCPAEQQSTNPNPQCASASTFKKVKYLPLDLL